MSRRDVPKSVLFLTILLGLAGLTTGVASGVARPEVTWAVAPLLAGLVLGGMLQLRFHYRGHLEALDLFEAALAPVVVLVPGLGTVVMAAVAKAISQRLMRVAPVKAAFNVAQWSAAAGTASLVFASLHGPTHVDGARSAALLAALVAAMAVNHLSVAIVLAIVQRRSVDEVFRGLAAIIVPGWIIGGGVNISFGLLFATGAANEPALAPLFLVPLVVLHWAQRAYAEASTDKARVQALHRATHELAGPVDPIDGVPGFLAVVAECFESSAVDLLLADGRSHHTGSVDTTRLTEWVAADLAKHAGGAVRYRAGDGSGIGALLESAGRRSCLAAPLGSGTSGSHGVLVSYDRAGLPGFEDGEAAVFEALARELDGAMERGGLLAALVQERSRLFNIVDRSSDGIFTLAADGRVETWNQAMEAITGFAADEVAERRGLALLRSRDNTGVEVDLAAWAGHGLVELPGDVEILTRRGEWRWLSCSYAETASTPASLVVVARDVTREREVERLKDDFVATVSHELRTPLTSIMGFTTLLMEPPRPLSEEQKMEALGMVRKGVRRLEQLIFNLLEVSVVEAKGDQFPPGRSVDIAEVCDTVIAELRNSWPKRDVVFHPGTGAVQAIGRQLSIEQIVSNLVGNALKYAPSGPVDVSVVEQPEWVEIRVTDHGPGIPDHEQERIFERFERLDHHHVQAGTGLGLYISRQLARAMSGDVTVTSTPGEGSTFCLRLPAEVHLVAVS